MAWIPDKFAVVGKILKLKNDDKEWEDGWVVMSVGKRSAMDEKMLIIHRDEYRYHRGVTDI